MPIHFHSFTEPSPAYRKGRRRPVPRAAEWAPCWPLPSPPTDRPFHVLSPLPLTRTDHRIPLLGACDMYYHDNVRRTFISGREMHLHFPKIDPVDKIRWITVTALISWLIFSIFKLATTSKKVILMWKQIEGNTPICSNHNLLFIVRHNWSLECSTRGWAFFSSHLYMDMLFFRLVIQEFLPRLAFGSYACFTSWV